MNDEIIMFKPLTEGDIGNILDLLVNELNSRIADRDLKVELTSEAKKYITVSGYDPAFGARPLKRYLQKHVETLVARLILEDKVEPGVAIIIDSDGEKLFAR